MERINDLSRLTVNMRLKVDDFLKECHESGVYCYPFETYRSQERHDWLYAQGRTRHGKIVTWTKTSNHTFGEAVDFVFGGEGKWTWNGPWKKMVQIAKKHGLRSLAPTEWAHLEDDGTKYNKKSMELKTNWFELMEQEVDSLNMTVGHNFADKEGFEEQLRAMVELMMDRKVKKVLKELQDGYNRHN